MQKTLGRTALCWGAAITVALTAALAATLALAQTPEPQQAAAGRVDLASAEMGGRIESATSQIAWENWAPTNLISSNAPASWGWSAEGNSKPQELVFSFLTQQAALIDTVVINPLPIPEEGGAAKDVEIWTSMDSATDGFTQVATASLEPEDADQAITFPAVEARYVKLRVLSAQPQFINNEPNEWPARLRRVRILEADRPGYVSMFSRNEDLAALARGEIPTAPADAVGSPIPADGPACELPTATPAKPNFAESRRVLVMANSQHSYTPSQWKPTRGAEIGNKNDYSLYARTSFTWITPYAVTPALLLPIQNFDTVVFSLVCDIDESVSPEFKQALMAWVADGHKLILQDSDRCAAATGPSRSPDYSFLPYPFATANPGAAGAKGQAHLLESSTLISGVREDPNFVDLEAWVNETDGNGQEIGDSNVVVKYDPHWCGAVFARNATQKNGFLLAYAKYGRGLIIYDGADYDQVGSPAYDKYITNILAQPFDPDNLPCSQPLGDFVLATDSSLKTQHLAVGSSYTYPLTVYSNNAYTGSVTINPSVLPADPTVSVTVEPATVELGELATATVTVTTTAATPATSHVVSLRGVDTAGKSNTLCLNLPERRSGSVQVLSGLRQDRKPPKNIEIILDASGSMKAMLGGKSRWAVAQDVLKEVVAKLPEDYAVGLRAYGHTLSSKDPNTCTDTALVLPVVPLDVDQLLAVAKGLAPRGETPLVYSILQTPADLQDIGGGTVILITDGEESCKGDFAAAAETLKASGLNLLLNIVGFTLDNAPAEAQLTQLAESTGGNYYGAASGEELARALLLAAVDRLPYRILDAAGEEVAQGEAGVGSAHELPAGNYTVVITAADLELRTPVKVEIAKDIVLTAAIKGSQLVVEEDASALEPTTGAPPSEAGAAAEPAESPPPETTMGAEPVDTQQSPTTVAANPADTPPAETMASADTATTPPAEVAVAANAAPTAPPGEVSPSGIPESALPSPRLEDLAALVDLVVADAADLPRAEFDPAALVVALDRDPQKLFEWVRDRTWWAPYRGLLRGAKGVMLDRVGSSLDRAVLLGDLLRRAGYTVRVAHTQLPEDRARELLVKVRPIPDQRRSPVAATPASAVRQRATETLIPGFEKVLKEQIAESRRRSDEAAALIRSQADQLSAAVRDVAAAAEADGQQAAVAALQDHWWVEREDSGQWIALDVLLPDARVGDALAAATETREWNAEAEAPAIPETDWHSVQIRVVVERYQGGGTTESVVLETTLRPADVLEQPVSLNHMPMPWPAEVTDSGTDPSALRNAALQVNEWVPILSAGDELIAQSGFTDAGDVKTNPFEPIADAGGGGLFGAMDSALSGGDVGGGHATAEWLDYEIQVPGEPPQHLRRPVFDLLGPARRAAQAAGFDASTDSLRLERFEALWGETDILLQSGDFTPEFVTHLLTTGIVANQAAFRELSQERDPAKAKSMASEILDRIDIWGPLPGLAYWRSTLGSQGAGWFVDRPNVLNYRVSPSLADGDRVTWRQLIDIASNGIGVRPGASRSSFEVRLRQGVADTVAEMLTLGTDFRMAENTASVFAMAGAGADHSVLIGPRDTAAAQELGWPADAAARLAQNVDAGYMVVALKEPVTLRGRQRAGWWRVDPLSGETIGVMDTGFHADLTEKSELESTLAQIRAWLTSKARKEARKKMTRAQRELDDAIALRLARVYRQLEDLIAATPK